jgi:DNA (cytosine-5)-methyltransferase 1
MRFIDLFAGLGGFHVGLARLGHECVFASELDPNLQELYEQNFGVRPHGDIRSIAVEAIPSHDILCAGSPCQPFSKAGDQQGFECPKWGDLFEYVLRVLRRHKPRYIILENVPNLERHDKGETWAHLKGELKKAGYTISTNHMSPHQYGIPQDSAARVHCRQPGRAEPFCMA